MNIAGLQPFSLMDFPGHIAAIVFTQGCNFRCPFCHNGHLICFEVNPQTHVAEEEVLALLQKRAGKLDGVMVTGGEATMQSDLGEFLSKVKNLGYETGLETNGSRPDVLKILIADKLLDFIAMDIKAPLECYERLCGVNVPLANIKASIELIAESGLAHEFRTTVVYALLSDGEIEALKALVPTGSRHVLQKFHPQNALDPALRDGTDEN